MQNGEKNVLSQAERSFFTLRYAVPGFTFIFILVLASYPTLREALFTETSVTLVAAFLAFFSLLGGGAIGFLVSQLWYLIDLAFLYGNYGKLRKLREYLKREYNLSDNRFDQVLFLDDIFRRHSDMRIQYYSQRRYDLRHTCGSTLVATFLGYSFGLAIRSGIFSTHMTLEQVINSLARDLPQIPQLVWSIITEAQIYDFLVFITFTFLLIVLALSLWRVSLEHARVIDKAVREIMNVHHGP